MSGREKSFCLLINSFPVRLLRAILLAIIWPFLSFRRQTVCERSGMTLCFFAEPNRSFSSRLLADYCEEER
jgi:hypothetical protein